MSRRLVTLMVLAAACRAPAPGPKESPFDFAAHVAPLPTEFSKEADIVASWNGPLKQWWSEQEHARFAGVDGVEIPFTVVRAAAPKAALVLLPGRTEARIKYAEVARDLVAQDYSVYLVELRGQGSAGRMLPDHDKGYVVAFDDYVQDVHRFIAEHVRPDAMAHALPITLLAHSTGAGVATLLVDTYPDDVKAMVLTSPMLDIATLGLPPAVIGSAGLTVCDSGADTGYVLGGGPYVAESDFSANTVTHSQPRWQYKVQQLADDPSLRLGSATWHWACQALIATSHAQALGAYNSLPTLMFSAGVDKIVKLPGQTRYCADAPHCTQVTYPSAYHELLQEADDVRNDLLSKAVSFLDAKVSP